jgi:hypothetical protein
VLDGRQDSAGGMDQNRTGRHNPCKLVPHSSGIGDKFWRDTLIDAGIFREWILNVGSREACHVVTVRAMNAGVSRSDRPQKLCARTWTTPPSLPSNPLPAEPAGKKYLGRLKARSLALSNRKRAVVLMCAHL